jgi:IS5 family transposase
VITRDKTMKQMTLAATRGFEKHNRATRKAEFLARLEGLMPWAEFCAVIEPHYPKSGNGRPPVGLERMLRMYCVANWFNLADEACEDALYDVARVPRVLPDRSGTGTGAGRHDPAQLSAPAGTKHTVFAKVGLLLANGMKLSGGTIVDATLIAAPPSANQDKSRDPEMHQTKKQPVVLRHEAAHRHGQPDRTGP